MPLIISEVGEEDAFIVLSKQPVDDWKVRGLIKNKELKI